MRMIQQPISWKQATWIEIKDCFRKIERAPFPLCITPEALQTVLGSVGSKLPETGAKAFGPVDFLGIDIVEPDPSSNSLSVVYSPDKEWGEKRMEYHLRHNRLWTADIHSHAGNFGSPSWKVGKGLGDLGYVEEVFKQNETMQFFFIPILTGTGTAEVCIWPWVCQRGEGDEPVLMFADLRVCNTSSFPARPFNPKWEKEVEDAKKPAKKESIPIQVIQPTSVKKNSEERSDTYGGNRYGNIL